jgi:flagellar motility protein MotE (MotC chaperone)
MIHLLHNFRIVPVVLVAAICLFTLKAFGIVFDGGYTLGDRWRDSDDVTGAIGGKATSPLAEEAPSPPPKQPKRQQSWAQQMFNYPDVTGSVPEQKSQPSEPPPAKESRPAPKEPAPKPSGTVVSLEGQQPSPAERALLERLQERRNELDERRRELDVRENLLKAAEKRLEARIAELKDLEARVNNAMQAKTDGEAARFKNLVMMYDNMKAKDAAKIFDRLDMKVLVEVATQINPRRMSDIMAQMSAEAAERLTIELAARAKDKEAVADLPKIEGKPISN